MAKIDVRVPDEQGALIDQLAESGQYSSRSEFVREAIRNEIRERIDRKQLREAKARLDELRDGEVEPVEHADVKEQAGIT
ncbi:MAG: type II toxin-antitoxin system ParD family antitoxin [Candidatus Nanohaloarchaea archaeon]